MTEKKLSTGNGHKDDDGLLYKLLSWFKNKNGVQQINATILDAVCLSQHIYGDDSGSKFGKWVPCRKEIEKKLGRELVWENGGFKSEVYLKKYIFGKLQYMYVFKGTNPKNLNDWYEDAQIFWGNPENSQYLNLGQKNTEEIKKVIGSAELILTGHSLGGGIAQWCAYKIQGVRAIVFNPLDPKIPNNGICDVFVVKDDILHKIHEIFKKRIDEGFIILPENKEFLNHGIDVVRKQLGKLK